MSDVFEKYGAKKAIIWHGYVTMLHRWLIIPPPEQAYCVNCATEIPESYRYMGSRKLDFCSPRCRWEHYD